MPRGADQVCYPSGGKSIELIRILKTLGVETARSTDTGRQQTPIISQDNYYLLPTYSAENDDLLWDMGGVDKAIQEGGKTIIFMIHKVEPTAGNLVITSADMITLCEHVKTYVDAGQVQVMTMSEWYAAQNKSVLVPVTPAAPAVTNNDTKDTVTGINLNMEYKLDGASSYTAYNTATFNAINFSGNHTLAVRYAAFGIDNPGADKILTFTSGQVTQYTVSFNSNGGSSVSNVVANAGAIITEPIAPTRTGYDFVGWYKDSGFSDDWDFSKDTVIANTTLYAKWMAHNYWVAYDKNNGSGTMVSGVYTYGVAKALSTNAYTRTGYTFAGWNTKADGSGTSYCRQTKRSQPVCR